MVTVIFLILAVAFLALAAFDLKIPRLVEPGWLGLAFAAAAAVAQLWPLLKG